MCGQKEKKFQVRTKVFGVLMIVMLLFVSTIMASNLNMVGK